MCLGSCTGVSPLIRFGLESTQEGARGKRYVNRGFPLYLGKGAKGKGGKKGSSGGSHFLTGPKSYSVKHIRRISTYTYIYIYIYICICICVCISISRRQRPPTPRFLFKVFGPEKFLGLLNVLKVFICF